MGLLRSAATMSAPAQTSNGGIARRQASCGRSVWATWNDPECESTIQSPLWATTGPSGVRTCTAAPASATDWASSPSQCQSTAQFF